MWDSAINISIVYEHLRGLAVAVFIPRHFIPLAGGPPEVRQMDLGWFGSGWARTAILSPTAGGGTGINGRVPYKLIALRDTRRPVWRPLLTVLD